MRLTQHGLHSSLRALFAVVYETVITVPEGQLQGLFAASIALHQHGEVYVRIPSNPHHGMAVGAVWVNVLATLSLQTSLHFTVATT